MEQLRKRFDSGLDISELLIENEKTSIQEQPEVCYYYCVYVNVLPCQLDETDTRWYRASIGD